MDTDDSKQRINVDYFENLTGDIAVPAPREVDEIGVRIRRLRQEKGLSVEELSNLTGFDPEFLSEMESNRAQPQLGTVIKLSKALDSAFGRLVSGVGSRLYSITRKGDRKTVSRSTARKGQRQVYTYKSLAPEVKGRHMEALIVELEENPERDLSVHDGEEFIYVLEGTATLAIGDERFELAPGRQRLLSVDHTPPDRGQDRTGPRFWRVLYGG